MTKNTTDALLEAYHEYTRAKLGFSMDVLSRHRVMEMVEDCGCLIGDLAIAADVILDMLMRVSFIRRNMNFLQDRSQNRFEISKRKAELEAACWNATTSHFKQSLGQLVRLNAKGARRHASYGTALLNHRSTMLKNSQQFVKKVARTDSFNKSLKSVLRLGILRRYKEVDWVQFEFIKHMEEHGAIDKPSQSDGCDYDALEMHIMTSSTS